MKRRGEIMDADKHDEREHHPDMGEGMGIRESKEPFSAVHVPTSGDIEDTDKHFVMTGKLRHTELKRAVLDKDETPEERQSDAVSQKTESEQAVVDYYQGLDDSKQKTKTQQARVHKLVQSKLKAHHLMQDAAGRVVPDV